VASVAPAASVWVVRYHTTTRELAGLSIASPPSSPPDDARRLARGTIAAELRN